MNGNCNIEQINTNCVLIGTTGSNQAITIEIDLSKYNYIYVMGTYVGENPGNIYGQPLIVPCQVLLNNIGVGFCGTLCLISSSYNVNYRYSLKATDSTHIYFTGASHNWQIYALK